MNFDQAGIQGKVALFSDLENVMHTLEMIRGGQWDWDHVTYDHKFENRDTGDIYYLRVQGYAVKGEVEQPDAEIQLMTPILGHHYYPHGVEYDEEFPDVLVNKCNDKLAQLKELLEGVELVQSESLKTEDVTQLLIEIPGVQNVSELHVWTNGSGQSMMSCHLIIDSDSQSDDVLEQAESKLKNDLGFQQTTLQIHKQSKAETAGNEQ
jgi:hypothetical protein